jgi:hypothetical protein
VTGTCDPIPFSYDGFLEQDLESVDLIDKMSTQQVVRILGDAYQNSEYAMETMARIHEILQMVCCFVLSPHP